MAANYDLVVIHGPPSSVVSQVLRQRLQDKDEYVHVYPPQLYQDHPGFGVRDIANHVLSFLKKHKKVVVEDSCASGGVRNCLLKVIPNKMPFCTLCLVELVPKHGQQQALWDRQFLLAVSAPLHRLLSDETLHRWFDEQGQTLSSGAVTEGPPRGSKETVTVKLSATSNFKFEVPALLIQWECVLDSGGYLEHRMKTACQHWSEANPCGRVVLLCDGNSVAKGVVSALQEKAQIISCAKAMALELPCPVYVLQLTSTLDAGDFCVPPSPGLVSFVHRRHLLDLHHRNSVYVYNDTKHMKMAEKAGMRHIRVGKVLANPQVMSSLHNATPSPVPEMLHQMEVAPDSASHGTTVTPAPSIPLADRLEDFADGHVCMDHPRGHREFVFAIDIQLLERFQRRYAESATPVGESGSRMATQPKAQRSISRDGVSLVEQTVESGQHRPIPQWMLGKRESSLGSASTQTSLEKSSSTSSVEGRSRSRHTVYIMTEKELLETAKEILKQAGKDLIPTSDVQSTMLLDSASSKPQFQTSVPEATPKKNPACASAREADTAMIADTGTFQLDDVQEVATAGGKKAKQRLEPVAEEQHTTAADREEGVTVPLENNQSESTAHLDAPQKAEKRPPPRKQAPDISFLDEIFS